MKYLFDNWFLLVGLAAVVIFCVVCMIRFFKMPTKMQIQAVKEWLVGVVTEAERELGSGTGALKLRQVYDLFVVRFPWLAKVVSFEIFADWVDEALVVMREMLAQNEAVKEYVGGEYEVMKTRKAGF